MTNFEKIKNMSVEELAEKLDELSDCAAALLKNSVIKRPSRDVYLVQMFGKTGLKVRWKND